MFAPTVTGSPIENACRVIARHERRGRGYYAGVLALLGHDDAGPADAGRADPDPHRGDLARRRPAGAGRRHPGPALHRRGRGGRDPHQGGGRAGRAGRGLRCRRSPVRAGAPSPPRSGRRWPPATTAWPASGSTRARPGALTVPALAGRTAVIVDGEDTFTAMLAHQLRALGLAVTVRALDCRRPVRRPPTWWWSGPGPGDPGDLGRPEDARPARPGRRRCSTAGGRCSRSAWATRSWPRRSGLRAAPPRRALPGAGPRHRPVRRDPPGRLLLQLHRRRRGDRRRHRRTARSSWPATRPTARCTPCAAPVSPACSSTPSRCSAATASPSSPNCFRHLLSRRG